MVKIKKDILRAIYTLGTGILIALWILFNNPEKFKVGILYIILGVITFLAFIYQDKFK